MGFSSNFEPFPGKLGWVSGSREEELGGEWSSICENHTTPVVCNGYGKNDEMKLFWLETRGAINVITKEASSKLISVHRGPRFGDVESHLKGTKGRSDAIKVRECTINRKSDSAQDAPRFSKFGNNTKKRYVYFEKNV